MKWMQRPSRLLKKLERIESDGKKLFEIRKAKRETQSNLLEHLAANGIQMERKVLGLIEDGVKPVLDHMYKPWLEFLEVTPEEAMITIPSSEKEPAPAPTKAAASEPENPKPAKRGKSVEQRVQFVNHCEGLCFEFFVERSNDGSLAIHVFNNEPVPNEVVEQAVGAGNEIARTWVDQPAYKYQNSPNPEDRKTVARKVTVTLK